MSNKYCIGNNIVLPEGWSMPDDLFKEISEWLNRITLRPENELADALEEMVRYIALIEPEPSDWGGWVQKFLEQLQSETERRAKYHDLPPKN